MKETGHKFTVLAVGIGFLVLILDSRLALEGARSGIDLCIRTVIPALFPFFVLSMVLTRTFHPEGSPFIRCITNFLGIPESAVSVLVPSFLGGYPVGATSVGDLFQNRQISRQQAERMLAFCSNAGPAFLFGMVSGFFPERNMILLLWITHIGSAAATALSLPPVPGNGSTQQDRHPSSETAVIPSAAIAMGTVCCWVILFRTMIAFLNDWFLWLMPPWAQVILTGVLELTNGCCELPAIADVRARFVVCACMISFGGICVLLQTASVTKGLSLRSYVKGKLIQTIFSAWISWGLAFGHGLISVLLIPILIILLRELQNRSRNPRTFPV